jgi:hypothetical protein
MPIPELAKEQAGDKTAPNLSENPVKSDRALEGLLYSENCFC